jgi:hypothetical protein
MYAISKMKIPQEYIDYDRQKEMKKAWNDEEPSWNWGEVPEVVQGKLGQCSWCDKNTVHTLSMVRDAVLTKLTGGITLFKCLGKHYCLAISS